MSVRKSVSFTICALAVFSALSGAPALSQDAGEGYMALVGDIGERYMNFVETTSGITDNIADAREKMEKTKRALLKIRSKLPRGGKAYKRISRALSALDTIDEHAENLASYTRLLHGHSEGVKSIYDAAMVIRAMREKAGKRKGGPLAGELSVLADVMEQFGEKVPLLGPALTFYGQATGKLLDATDKLEQTIREKVYQGALISSSKSKDPRLLQLKKQYPRVADEGLMPVAPPRCYNLIGKSDGYYYFWDSGARKWSRSKFSKTIEEIFTDGLLAGKRFNVRKLEYLARHTSGLRTREERAAQFLKLIRKARRNLAFITLTVDADTLTRHRFAIDMSAPRRFIAKYVYDGHYKAGVFRYAAILWARAMLENPRSALVQGLNRWAEDNGVMLEQFLTEDDRRRLARLTGRKTPRRFMPPCGEMGPLAAFHKGFGRSDALYAGPKALRRSGGARFSVPLQGPGDLHIQVFSWGRHRYSSHIYDASRFAAGVRVSGAVKGWVSGGHYFPGVTDKGRDGKFFRIRQEGAVSVSLELYPEFCRATHTKKGLSCCNYRCGEPPIYMKLPSQHSILVHYRPKCAGGKRRAASPRRKAAADRANDCADVPGRPSLKKGALMKRLRCRRIGE